ncbi:T9SS type A sorting domain-containing protein, partial [bacterium]|nr:T9SS type A sorting domain-containing protein [bacterium]
TNATPTSLDVWCKRFLGWITPYNATANVAFSFNHIINTAANGAARLAKLGSASASQYWLVENRSRSAAGPVSNVAWDANLPGAGLAIYHVDDSYTTATHIGNNDVNVNSTNGSSRNRPYGVAMEETDETTAGYTSELWTGANRGEAVDVWTSGTQGGNFDSTGTAYPITYLNDGTSRSGTAVRRIPAAGKDGGFAKAMQCTLYVIPGGPLGVQLSQLTAAAGEAGVTVRWRTESEDGSYCWDVERCDGGEYQVLGTIPAYGTTSIPHDYSFTDPAPPAGACYYRIAEVDLSGARTVYGPVEIMVRERPAAAALLPPWPNPGRGAVTIPFALPRAQPVSLVIFNALGQRVRTLVAGELGAGRHDEAWDGTDDRGRTVASGVYVYRLRSGDLNGTGKLSILR